MGLDAIILEHTVLIISTVGRVLSPAHEARLSSSVGRVIDYISHNSLVLGMQIVVDDIIIKTASTTG